MYSNKNYIEAKSEIMNRRADARATADARRAEVELEHPEIAAIDKELSGVGLLLFKTACSGGDIEPIKERNIALQKKRGELLVSLGYAADYTDVHYTCPICGDTGFDGAKMCSCLRELLIRKNIMSSGMGRLIDKQSFDNFDLEWYKVNDADYKRMSQNLAVARAYAKGFAAEKGNLLLIGSTGTGKTHISTAIAKEVIKGGFDVLYDSAHNILSEMQNDQFRDRYKVPEAQSEKYLECDLLIIDDLGTEFTTQMTLSFLYNLINTRQNKGLGTIISTNLSAAELATKYEGRIYSRIVGSDYRVLVFSGRDHRVGI